MTDGRRVAAAERRRRREAEIVAATRELFATRGVRDTQIEHVAAAVGVNRAIVYRHFTGKEELFALAVVSYLEELRERLVEAADSAADPTTQLQAITKAFVDFGLEHPPFADCAQTLMRSTGEDLLKEMSETAVLRLGRAMSGCLSVLSGVLTEGNEQGVFAVDDPTLLANLFYASGLGALQLARVGLLVGESAPGVPSASQVTGDQVRDYLVAYVLALAAK
jgi:AcrR family transcriptional regulator